MNFATATGAGGGCSTRIVDDSIDDTKPQLLNLGSLATVWPQQRQQAQQQLLGQDLLSSVVDGPLFSTNASSTPSINANNVSNTSPQSSSSNGGNNGNMANTPGGADGGDAEGVWSPDIDQAFHEALQIYPPCGRRKIILSDEGKMYGRNELIARYIKIRCGKTRTRKQVSSHIQVLARKKQREHQARMKVHHHQQDGQQTDFGMSQHQQLAPPPSTSGSISPNPGAPLGGADPSSVESNQSSAFHHTNICTAANTNGITNGGDILPPPFSGGGASGGVDDVGGGGATSAPSLTTTKAAAPNANLLLGMAPANNLTTVGQRESVVNASTMHQKMLEAASAISNSVMSSMPNPSTTNWPYSLNAQHLLGGIQMAASRPPHDLYTSILGGLQPAAVLKTESPNNGGMITTTSLPNGASAAVPCHSSGSSFAIDNFTIASSRLILCGFTAYIEQNLCGGGAGGMAVDGEESRVEIIKIPKISDAPLERIGLECVQSKYPELLQELFKKGPTDAFFLVKCWANMHFNFGDQHNSLFAVDSFYESSDKFDITVSTKVCSFGNEVVEKVEIYSPIDEEEEARCSGVWHFRLEKSPMCEYMGIRRECVDNAPKNAGGSFGHLQQRHVFNAKSVDHKLALLVECTALVGAASRPPHDLYSSILGGLQPAAVLKVKCVESPNNGGMITTTSLPNGASAAVPCHSSASSFAIDNFTIASSRLILCGFTAYIEQNLCGGGAGGMAVDGEESRVEIIKIPKISDAPLERIGLECVQSKYPELLQELFKKGPTDAFFLVKCWANMHFNFGDQHNSLFAVDSFYESSDKFDITVSTKVCSFGNEVVEKVEIYSPIDEEEEARCSGVWHFRLEKSPMCEYMVRFISELKKLPQPSMMNSVLENFTVLQIVTDKQSNNTLMVIAFMFGVREDSNNVGEDGDDEMFTNIYRITE
uniref:TEA domain-containing protein n=1 Tax=Globodera pallida TaxID=36090 RepID=A0A183BP56_GLOPA